MNLQEKFWAYKHLRQFGILYTGKYLKTAQDAHVILKAMIRCGLDDSPNNYPNGNPLAIEREGLKVLITK